MLSRGVPDADFCVLYKSDMRGWRGSEATENVGGARLGETPLLARSAHSYTAPKIRIPRARRQTNYLPIHTFPPLGSPIAADRRAAACADASLLLPRKAAAVAPTSHSTCLEAPWGLEGEEGEEGGVGLVDAMAATSTTLLGTTTHSRTQAVAQAHFGVGAQGQGRSRCTHGNVAKTKSLTTGAILPTVWLPSPSSRSSSSWQ